MFKRNNIIKYDDGSYYEGEIKDGKPNGEGKLFKKEKINQNKNKRLYKYNDYNKYTIKNVIKYEGQWKDGVKHGNGKDYYINKVLNNSVLFEGNYKDGKKDGDGTLYNEIIMNRIDRYKAGGPANFTFSTEVVVYSGNWKNDKYDGIGEECFMEIYDTNVNGEEIDNNIKYEGEFKDGKYNGNGKLYYNEKTRQQIRDGGRVEWRNKIQYEGEFKNCEFHGNGKEFYPNSKQIKYEGEYEDGYQTGKGKYYNIHGKEGVFLNDGRFVSKNNTNNTNNRNISGGNIKSKNKSLKINKSLKKTKKN